MYDGAVVRNSCLFLLILGLFVPHALAAFAVCQAGWDWVSNLNFEVVSPLGERADVVLIAKGFQL